MIPTVRASRQLSSCVGKRVHVAYERRWSNASLSTTHLLAKERDAYEARWQSCTEMFFFSALTQ